MNAKGKIHNKFDIRKIERDEALQARIKLDLETVQKYVEDMKNGDKFPELILFQEGERDAARYWLADGWHRLAAYEQNQQYKVSVSVYQGTYRDASSMRWALTLDMVSIAPERINKKLLIRLSWIPNGSNGPMKKLPNASMSMGRRSETGGGNWRTQAQSPRSPPAKRPAMEKPRQQARTTLERNDRLANLLPPIRRMV